MDKRDPQTRFRHQQDLHSKRPAEGPDAIAKMRESGRVLLAQSFNLMISDQEASLVLAIEGQEPLALRLNPDVVLNLGLNLLKAGGQMQWFDVDLRNNNPPQPH